MKQSIHIGEEIRKQLAIQKRPVAWLATELYIDPSNFRKMLNKSYISTDLLYRISSLLDTDFFAYYSHLFAEDQKRVNITRFSGKLCPHNLHL